MVVYKYICCLCRMVQSNLEQFYSFNNYFGRKQLNSKLLFFMIYYYYSSFVITVTIFFLIHKIVYEQGIYKIFTLIVPPGVQLKFVWFGVACLSLYIPTSPDNCPHGQLDFLACFVNFKYI